jgi:hypothetical protein
MTSPPIDALTDEQAINVLALVLDRNRRLPGQTALHDLAAQVAAAVETGVEAEDGSELAVPEADGEVTSGDLARATLTYLVAEQPDAASVIERAIAMAGQGIGTPSRFDPITVGVGALVVLALQTDVQLERTTGGKWRFKVHKQAMKDSTLGRLLGKLISAYTGASGQ